MKTFRIGFSMIELLVVVAIIMILTSLLLPGLSKAKETAKTATCRGNIRQTYMGVSSYASDFNGYAPFYRPWLAATAADAMTSNVPIRVAFGDTWGSYRGGQMVDPKYWPESVLRCPDRNDWETIGAAGVCFNVSGYYRKNAVYRDGANRYVCASYALKACSLASWGSGAALVNSATANLSYRLGQNPGETLMMDYYSISRAPNPRHKFVVIYEDGASNAVLIKTWAQVTVMTGNADRFMDIVRKMGRDYAGVKSW